MKPVRGPCVQRGVALVIGMVILVIMTLTVLSAVSMSTSNVKATSNMQFRDAAFAAANVAVEQVVSTRFMDVPEPTDGDVDRVYSNVGVDIDLDGTRDYLVSVAWPACSYWRRVSNLDLDITNEDDLKCFSGSGTGGGGVGGGKASVCAETLWVLQAPVGDQATGASVTVNQGIGVRMDLTGADAACN